MKKELDSAREKHQVFSGLSESEIKIVEKLNWKTNLDIVKLARSLLMDKEHPYTRSYDEEQQMCVYRMKTDTNIRCIVGRLLYGHLPEDHPFWNDTLAIVESWSKYSLFNKFPGISPNILSYIQVWHDDALSRPVVPLWCMPWDEIEAMAKVADMVAAKE